MAALGFQKKDQVGKLSFHQEMKFLNCLRVPKPLTVPTQAVYWDWWSCIAASTKLFWVLLLTDLSLSLGFLLSCSIQAWAISLALLLVCVTQAGAVNLFVTFVRAVGCPLAFFFQELVLAGLMGEGTLMSWSKMLCHPRCCWTEVLGPSANLVFSPLSKEATRVKGLTWFGKSVWSFGGLFWLSVGTSSKGKVTGILLATGLQLSGGHCPARVEMSLSVQSSILWT